MDNPKNTTKTIMDIFRFAFMIGSKICNATKESPKYQQSEFRSEFGDYLRKINK